MEVIKLKEWYETNAKEKWLEVRDTLILFDKFINNQTITQHLIQEFLERLRRDDRLNQTVIYGLARYFKIYSHVGQEYNHHFVYMTKLIGGDGVLESMSSKASKYMTPSEVNKVFKKLKPPMAIEPQKMPTYTVNILTSLEYLEANEKKDILTGNHHQIPREAFLEDKKIYENMSSLEAYLEYRHQDKIKELEKHCEENRVWYEQIITNEVIDYVKSSQEILSAIREENSLFVTKIPYDTVSYIHAKTDLLKRYHYCHCPFVKESILSNKIIDGDWCYCSAGFAKHPFEVILDKPLKVEVLESVIKGDMRCRFKIDLA